MRCEEAKTLIVETSDLKSLGLNQEFSLHVQQCKVCQSSLKFEEKIREGFSLMAEQNPPAQLAEMVFSIPEIHGKTIQGKKEPSESFLTIIANMLKGSPFKTAFVSCMVGFFAALILSNSGLLNSSTFSTPPNFELARKSATEVIQRKESPEILRQPPIAGLDAMKNENFQIVDSGVTEKKSDLIIKAEGAIEHFKKMDKLRPAKPMKEEETKANSDEIPGAVTFQIASAEEERAQASEMKVGKLAQSPEPSFAGSSISFTPPPKDKIMLATRARPFDLESISKKESRKGNLDDSFAADMEESFSSADAEKAAENKIMQEDPRCAELEKLINAYSLDISDGKLDLENWAARGIIPTEDLSHFSPPPGMAWYCEQSAGKNKVLLRQEK